MTQRTPQEPSSPRQQPGERIRSSRRLRVAAYCRVSTDQEEQQGSFENQVRTYRQRIAANPDWEFAGIYADEGTSGTRADRRAGFQQMMQDCQAHKIDLILTKSISRFARNVIDSLKYTRELKALGIPVVFEEEHLQSTDPGAEMIFTILSAVAEQESRNISEHTKWSIRNGYQQGRYKKTVTALYGYTKGPDGQAVIVESQADIVRMMFTNYLDGMNPNEIAHNLNEMGILGRRGCPWQNGTVLSILTNEKYKGDVYLQKNYVRDFMEHRLVKNTGELEQFTIHDAHPAIVDAQNWDAVQEEMERRRRMADQSGVLVYAKKNNPYSGKVFMQNVCHAPLVKHSYGNAEGTWKCRWYSGRLHPVCSKPATEDEAAQDTNDAILSGTAAATSLPDSDVASARGTEDSVMTRDAENSVPPATPALARHPLPCRDTVINHRFIRLFFLTAWNDMIEDDLLNRRVSWESTRVSDLSTPLQKVRASQMLQLTAGGAAAKLEEDIPEIVRMVLGRMDILDHEHATVAFLDGTIRHVTLTEY